MLIFRRIAMIFSIFIAVSHVAMASNLGESIATKGNGKGASACSTCHGVNGSGLASAGFPRLAGLNAAYIEKQLRDFTNAKRSSPVMAPMAKALSAKDIKAVADYYSRMKLNTPETNSSNNKTLLLKGKKLAEHGNWPNDIPACFTCHGAGATGIGTHFPALAGQHASYIEQQLKSWQSGQRDNDPNQLMKGVAKRLSVTEIKAVSAYLSSLATAAQ